MPTFSNIYRYAHSDMPFSLTYTHPRLTREVRLYDNDLKDELYYFQTLEYQLKKAIAKRDSSSVKILSLQLVESKKKINVLKEDLLISRGELIAIVHDSGEKEYLTQDQLHSLCLQIYSSLIGTSFCFYSAEDLISIDEDNNNKFYCPIALSLMYYPVTVGSKSDVEHNANFTFEYQSIRTALQKKPAINPLTNEKIADIELRFNKKLFIELILTLKEKQINASSKIKP